MKNNEEIKKDGNDTFKLLVGLIVVSLAVIVLGSLVAEKALDKDRNHTINYLYPETNQGSTNTTITIDNACEDKPVINLYNYINNNQVYSGIANTDNKVDTVSKDIKANIKLRLQNGNLTCTYPKYDNLKGWNVEVSNVLDKEAGGTILNIDDNKEYNYLYWEGTSAINYNPNEGFVIAAEDTSAFLEDALKTLGLNRREANEFIVYWLPKMESNKYNYITFLAEGYTDKAELMIEPKPDNLLRVYMMFKGLNSEDEMEPLAQNLEELKGDFKREGFTVVEWGGTEILSDRIQ